MRNAFLKIFVFLIALCVPLVPVIALGQVTNGDFSGGGAGWTTVAPGTGDNIAYTSNRLTATSNNICNCTTGPNVQTFASQSITLTDPGYLSYQLISYSSGDSGNFDFPITIIDGTQLRIRTSGVLSNTGTLVSNANQASNLTGGFGLTTAGSHTIAFGVRSTDSGFGSGTAVWDNIAFQELTQSPSAQSTPQDNSLTLSGVNAPQVATNSSLASMSVTLSVGNGTLTLASTAGVTITGGANNSGSVTFSGSPASINNAMNGLVYTPNTGFSGSDVLVFSGAGGTVSDTDNIGITVTPTPVSTMSVTKLADDTTNVVVGQIITYTYRVTNTGNQLLSAISLADSHNGAGPAPVPGSETLSVDAAPTGDSVDAATNGIWDSLAPGDQITFTATYTVTQSDVDTLQ